MKFEEDIEVLEYDDEKINESERTYLKTDEEKEKARKETTPCPHCGKPSDNLINCGLDCVYHEPREGKPCRCTKVKVKGDLLIETTNYCSFKKKSLKEKYNLEDIEL
ncbi:MAG: hypothetical protein ACOC1K_08335 [Nanoarchaeota archaeon]